LLLRLEVGLQLQRQLGICASDNVSIRTYQPDCCIPRCFPVHLPGTFYMDVRFASFAVRITVKESCSSPHNIKLVQKLVHLPAFGSVRGGGLVYLGLCLLLHKDLEA